MTIIENPDLDELFGAPTEPANDPDSPADKPPNRDAWKTTLTRIRAGASNLKNRAGRGRPTPPRDHITPPPPPPVPRPPLPPRTLAIRRVVWVTGALTLAFLINLSVISQLNYHVYQQQRFDSFRDQLALATAPVSEVDMNNRLLESGAPVAQLEIPAIGLSTIIVEGSGSHETMYGPGHRRDTVLPGQYGTSVIHGRAAAYGGPFGRVAELAPGDTFTVTTGQGEHLYRVIGVRYAGDPGPPPPAADESRLVLVTARGPAYIPTGVVRVDAQLTSAISPAGPRVTVSASLPPSAQPMATDTSTVWALVLWLQALLIVELAALWCARRWGVRETWLVFSILGLAVGFRVADQITKLLPNLL